MNKHHFPQGAILPLLVIILFSCKTKTPADTAPPIVEKVLPVPKAREVIHNALLHSSIHFWNVYYSMSEASDTAVKDSARLLLIARMDSIVALGKEKYKTSLNVLKGVANPDSTIVYKEYAMRIMDRINIFYNEKYPAYIRTLKSGINKDVGPAFDSIYNFVELTSADYTSFEEASDSIRRKYNLPKTWHFIRSASDYPVDIDDKILSDTSSH